MSTRKNIRIAIVAAQVAGGLLVALFVALGINALVSAQLVAAIPAEVSVADETPDEVEAPVASAPNAMVYNRNLFNQAAGVEPPAEPVAGDGAANEAEPESEDELTEPVDGQPPQSDLPLQLVGTMVSTDARLSVAYLLDEGNEEHVTHIGEEPVEGAELVRIRRTYILFRRSDKGGRIEYLALAGKSGSPLITRGTARNTATPNRNITSARVSTAKAPNKTKFEMNDGVVQMQQSMKRNAEGVVVNREAIQQQAEHRDKLVERMRIETMSTGGDRMGVRVGEVPPGSVFAGMGLHPGDVIVGVNGRQISEPEESMEFLESLAAKGEAIVEIDRRGRQQKINLRAE